MRRQPLLLALILSLVLMGLVLLPTTPSWGASWVAEFTIGETKYVVNGQPFFMDVAPYIKNGRTYLPVRYVAYALGVPEGGIGYHDGVVTLMDDRVVQMTIGSKFLRVDAATISMDVAPVTRGSRTMLPLRWIAQAFGANVDWDPVYQKVTISLSEAQPVSQTSTGRVVRQNQPPQAPSGLYLVSIAQGSAGGSYYVTLQWDSVSDATGYRIYGRPSYGDK
ncbi:MAG: copper amine oxidase N-terminal domain-containing protein, partial [Clostridia bacterium]|nr:copper amine oxidase N-terminal domain-containing protein [Clostridia bacterium]